MCEKNIKPNHLLGHQPGNNPTSKINLWLNNLSLLILRCTAVHENILFSTVSVQIAIQQNLSESNQIESPVAITQILLSYLGDTLGADGGVRRHLELE